MSPTMSSGSSSLRMSNSSSNVSPCVKKPLSIFGSIICRWDLETPQLFKISTSSQYLKCAQSFKQGKVWILDELTGIEDLRESA